eukprot:TRINITY_DN7653_c0_g1_i1.p1 TRINITY_DN7653_c0_g1~~TRINITY_DN7653_c0_g1_i1.p1  ORF type:complete len:213 (+),score=41.07 TRINITY_DN7653_c0_g1_i1:107-745(+)
MGQCCAAGHGDDVEQEMTGVEKMKTGGHTQPKAFRKADAKVNRRAARADGFPVKAKATGQEGGTRTRADLRDLKRDELEASVLSGAISALSSDTDRQLVGRQANAYAASGHIAPGKAKGSRVVDKVADFERRRTAAEAPVTVVASDGAASSDGGSAERPTLQRQLSLGLISIGSVNSDDCLQNSSRALENPPPLPPAPAADALAAPPAAAVQ